MTDLANDITVEESAITLADHTEDYLLQRDIFNEKYYVSYLKFAALAWNELFSDTLFIYNARWLKVEFIGGRHIVKFPKDCTGFISANITDHCNLIKRVPLNNSINVIPKPNPANVTCSALIASFVTTTKYLFTSSGVDYYQTQYLQYCPNGDIIERTVTPTKKYADFTGDVPGDYNNDYNNDYNHEAFGNFTIVNDVSQRMLANLDTEVDGQPKNTTENLNAILNCCGCYSNFAQLCCVEPVYNALDIGCYGAVSLSENRRYLVYTPPSTFNRCHNGNMPDYIMVYFKGSSSGNEITGAAIIPDDFHIKNSLTLGIDWYSVRMNRTISEREKPAYRARFDHSINELVRNRLFMSFDVLQKIGELKIQW